MALQRTATTVHDLDGSGGAKTYDFAWRERMAALLFFR